MTIQSSYEMSPVTTFDRKTVAFATCRNEPFLNTSFGNVCLVVRIGKTDRRLEYLAALKRAAERKDSTSAFRQNSRD